MIYMTNSAAYFAIPSEKGSRLTERCFEGRKRLVLPSTYVLSSHRILTSQWRLRPSSSRPLRLHKAHPRSGFSFTKSHQNSTEKFRLSWWPHQFGIPHLPASIYRALRGWLPWVSQLSPILPTTDIIYGSVFICIKFLSYTKYCIIVSSLSSLHAVLSLDVWLPTPSYQHSLFVCRLLL